MKYLYFQCNMGAAGDMLMGALYDLLPPSEQKKFLDTMNDLGLPGIQVTAAREQKCGIYGTHMHVVVRGEEEDAHLHGHDHDCEHEHEHDHEHAHELSHDHEHAHSHTHEHTHHHEHEHNHEHSHEHAHHHASYQSILHQISHLPLPEKVREHAAAVYRLIGEAEAKAHNTDIEQIHFHEVGTLDALADVVGCCLLIHMLEPDKIMASPIHVGSGTVRCAHGILPVPAPATAEILKQVPIYSGQIEGELCTPTGAALLKHFAASFTSMPPMLVSAAGYGMGTKDFPQANCVRAFLGEAYRTESRSPSGAHEPSAAEEGSGVQEPSAAKGGSESAWNPSQMEGTILSLSCNLDDITGEALSFAAAQLMEQGALDVYTTAIGMKKGRPGQLLTCLCRPEDEEKMTKLIFLHTTTRGIRVQEFRRHVLSQSFRREETPYGSVTVKQSQGYGVEREKPEFEDMAKIARENEIPLDSVLK